MRRAPGALPWGCVFDPISATAYQFDASEFGTNTYDVDKVETRNVQKKDLKIPIYHFSIST